MSKPLTIRKLRKHLKDLESRHDPDTTVYIEEWDHPTRPPVSVCETAILHLTREDEDGGKERRKVFLLRGNAVPDDVKELLQAIGEEVEDD